MELSEETFHEIHQYLSGQGTPDDRAAFENRMNADKELTEEVASQRRIRNGLKANEYKALFKDIHAQLKSEGALPDNPQPENDDVKVVPLAPHSPKENARWRYLAAAASVLIAVGLVWYFNSGPKSTEVASDTPETPVVKDTATQVLPEERPDTTKTNAPVQQPAQPAPARVNASEFFATYFDPNATLESPFSQEKLGVSPSAIAQWRSDTARVQQGIRYLAKQNAALALQEFDQVETSRFQQLKGTANWYKALAYLQQNDLKNCEAQLKKVIADPENTYHKQAGKLLAKIQ
ncbi:hypothetical protein SAMN05216327_12528 [Dyadobacter sp. SG02]|uniref:anti-sigma factor family protein n=1 Tax=Dyadobacter sp. SG02 TaxID=1855291 RepID=UPI0008B3E9C7|nr:hypothetical protein [Dyadobacter sp. SG02]SEJ85066.1 hypothetical protein SAMN05216327_12528 [Dyadobacter sp. SG02]